MPGGLPGRTGKSELSDALTTLEAVGPTSGRGWTGRDQWDRVKRQVQFGGLNLLWRTVVQGTVGFSF